MTLHQILADIIDEATDWPVDAHAMAAAVEAALRNGIEVECERCEEGTILVVNKGIEPCPKKCNGGRVTKRWLVVDDDDGWAGGINDAIYDAINGNRHLHEQVEAVLATLRQQAEKVL